MIFIVLIKFLIDTIDFEHIESKLNMQSVYLMASNKMNLDG